MFLLDYHEKGFSLSGVLRGHQVSCISTPTSETTVHQGQSKRNSCRLVNSRKGQLQPYKTHTYALDYHANRNHDHSIMGPSKESTVAEFAYLVRPPHRWFYRDGTWYEVQDILLIRLSARYCVHWRSRSFMLWWTYIHTHILNNAIRRPSSCFICR